MLLGWEICMNVALDNGHERAANSLDKRDKHNVLTRHGSDSLHFPSIILPVKSYYTTMAYCASNEIF